MAKPLPFDKIDKTPKTFHVIITMKVCEAFPDGKIFKRQRQHWNKEKLEQAIDEELQKWKHYENIRTIIVARKK